jgi:hypothetical protein
MGPRGYFYEIKQPEGEAEYSQRSADVKNDVAIPPLSHVHMEWRLIE